jgi:hypothetical protein
LIYIYELPDDLLCTKNILASDPSSKALKTIDESTICLFLRNAKISIFTNAEQPTAEVQEMNFGEIGQGSGIYNDGFIYYRTGDSIKRVSVNNGSTVTILDDPNLIRWSVAGDIIIFSKYVTATEVNTYQILKDGSGPAELISTSNMEITQIVELAF